MPPKQAVVAQAIKELLDSEDFEETLSNTVSSKLDEISSKLDNISKKLDHHDERFSAIESSIRRTDIRLTEVYDEFTSKCEHLHTSSEKAESAIMDVELKMNERESAIKRLQSELDANLNKVTTLERQVNSLEQYSRRSCIRIFGLKEKHGENTDTLVCEVAKQINVDLQAEDIDRSHRVGDPSTVTRKGERPIIVKLKSYHKRQELLQNRRKLKNKGITIQEDLTERNRALLQEAYKLFKKGTVQGAWSSNGRVFVSIPNTTGSPKRKLITCTEDLTKIAPQP